MVGLIGRLGRGVLRMFLLLRRVGIVRREGGGRAVGGCGRSSFGGWGCSWGWCRW